MDKFIMIIFISLSVIFLVSCKPKPDSILIMGDSRVSDGNLEFYLGYHFNSVTTIHFSGKDIQTILGSVSPAIIINSDVIILVGGVNNWNNTSNFNSLVKFVKYWSHKKEVLILEEPPINNKVKEWNNLLYSSKFTKEYIISLRGLVFDDADMFYPKKLQPDGIHWTRSVSSNLCDLICQTLED